MNQKLSKRLRRQARALSMYVRTVYDDTSNSKPKQCGFKREVLPSGATVTIPFYHETVQRKVNAGCQRGEYLRLKAQHSL